ncbi:uncharacterized protein LOC120296039 [Eucalyptus grandis]|uniref:uncharacterized protein LOC120296039 n=1 Tax=Eucalyptus grandis TaxID=71139 RepID=UPI00192EF1A3|nr:uncharacterized protein LOC120296039 [Eucalyptus grandis]
MNFASPAYINEVIELIVLALKEDGSKVFGATRATNVADHHDFSGTAQAKDGEVPEESKLPRAADWAMVLEAATQRRTEVLMPENLENMWSKGRNYKIMEDLWL